MDSSRDHDRRDQSQATGLTYEQVMAMSTPQKLEKLASMLVEIARLEGKYEALNERRFNPNTVDYEADLAVDHEIDAVSPVV